MIKLKENFPLSKISNYKIGGPARYFFQPKTEQELKDALLEAKKMKLKVLVLGGGTNILFKDSGFDGMVLQPKFEFVKISGNEIEAGAGVMSSKLVEAAGKRSLSGLEWAGGLPGSLGGAVRGNAGCFGGEIKDVVVKVRSFNVKTLKEIIRSNKQCKFGYRTSIFKEKNGEVIVSAVLKLAPGKKSEIIKATKEKVDFRKAKHPLDYPNIGSMFKNVPLSEVKKAHQKKFAHVIKNDPVPVVPVAYLLSEAGLKGVTCGGAMISPKHPNFIVNVLQASSDDVMNLITLAKSEIKKRYGLNLEEEVLIA